jgi:hypothetical protein
LPVGFYFVAVALVSICEAYAGVSNSQQVKTDVTVVSNSPFEGKNYDGLLPVGYAYICSAYVDDTNR